MPNQRAAFIFENIFILLNKKINKKKVLNILKENYQVKFGKHKTIAGKGKFKTINIWEKQLRKIEQIYNKSN